MTTLHAAHVAVLEALKSAQTLLVCVCSQSLYTRQDLIIQAENIDDQITAAIDLMKQSWWQPIETAPKEAPYWVVWSAYYKRPVVVTLRMDNNTYWEGDWDYDVQATHWFPPLPAAPTEASR